MIQDVLMEYNILSKVIKVVTDNGSNFIKALKENALDKNGIVVINLAKMLKEANNFNLPIHQRCASHTLNLCMTYDIKKALEVALKQKQNIEIQCDSDEDNIVEEELDLDVSFVNSAIIYNKIYTSTFTKCKDLWTRANKSTVAADTIKNILGKYLITPNDTRWNSLLDSSSMLLSLIEENPLCVKKVFKQLNIDYLSNDEISFLRKYVNVSSNSLNYRLFIFYLLHLHSFFFSFFFFT